jgi:hypothetical protein
VTSDGLKVLVTGYSRGASVAFDYITVRSQPGSNLHGLAAGGGGRARLIAFLLLDHQRVPDQPLQPRL